MRKSAITVRGAETRLTFLLWHQLVYTIHFASDFLSWCSSWFGDKICNVLRKFSISNWLLDNSHAWRLRAGRFWCWNFLLLVLIVLEKVCLFCLIWAFNNLSVISRQCLDVIGSSMLTFRVLPFGESGRQTGAETSHCRTSENHACCG